MCDNRVLLRRSKQPRPVYHITSSCFTFEVKTDRALGIYLSEDIERKQKCWIAIGAEYSEIRNVYGEKKVIKTQDAINARRFKSFWMSWYDDCIRVGREGNHRPFMEMKEDTSLMQYVTFNILGSRKTAAVKINLPPVRPPEKIKYFDDGMPTWVTMRYRDKNRIPVDAVIGGYGKDTLYVIRASHGRSLTPGKFASSSGTAYIPWGGEAHTKKKFEVLCGYNYRWVKTSHKKIPVNAVKGGYSEVNEEPLYVGRVEHKGCLIPGKVQPSHEVCYVAYKDHEISKSEYEILISVEECGYDTHLEYINYSSSSSSSSDESDLGFGLYD